MLLFAVTAGALWLVGAATGLSRPVRWAMIGVLYLGILIAVLILPDENGLRAALGASFAEWSLLGVAVLIGWAYAIFIRALRNRAHGAEPHPQSDRFGATELDRYARHIFLREIGGNGQRKLRNARVLVIGAGGLGSPALQYLAAAGVGTLGVVDDDDVEVTNLQRQVIHKDKHIGIAKVFSAEQAVKAQNPYVTVLPYRRRIDDDVADELISDFDLVLDGTDDTDTRYLVNRVCARHEKPLISGALGQWEGQISVFDPASGTPCYQCVFPEPAAAGLAPTCAEAGVLSPLPGVVGSMMAVEAVKAITGAGQTLRGRMLIYDALYGETRTITLKPRPDCPVCGQSKPNAGATA